MVPDLNKLKSKNNKIWPCWELYKAQDGGFAVYDANAIEWSAVRIPGNENEAKKWLTDNKINFTDREGNRHTF